jgi:hypothetical protein
METQGCRTVCMKPARRSVSLVFSRSGRRFVRSNRRLDVSACAVHLLIRAGIPVYLCCSLAGWL